MGMGTFRLETEVHAAFFCVALRVRTLEFSADFPGCG